ncbi:hypothetical protein AAD001_11555 [Colwelliaceae bacterium 6471]
MNNIRFAICLSVACIISPLKAKEIASDIQLKPSELNITSELHPQSVCNAIVDFANEPLHNTQSVKLNENVSIELNQFLSETYFNGAKVKSNVICQKLYGSQYTGSEPEWALFIQNAIENFKRTGIESGRLVFPSDVDKVYSKNLDNKEYAFFGNYNGTKQIFKNIAILDKRHNTVFTISVSGADRAKHKINEEFQRLVNSFKLTDLDIDDREIN